MIDPMSDLPKETIDTVLALAAEGLPVEQVSFMARVSPSAVRAILVTAGSIENVTEPKNSSGN